MNLVYLNGSYLPPEEARVPVADRGLAYGDGVFTTVKVSGGAPLFLGWHLERLGRDAAAIHLPAPPAEELADACAGLVSRAGVADGVVKITVTRGVGERGPSTRGAGEPTVIVTVSGPPAPRPPLRAMTVPDDRGPLAAHKTLNYLPNVLALRRAEAAGCDEAVFARDGTLVEASASNVVGIVDGEPRTPPLNGRILHGVARRALLEAGALAEGPLPSDTAGPLYCVNNVRGIESVAELDGQTLLRDRRVQALLEKALQGQARTAGRG